MSNVRLMNFDTYTMVFEDKAQYITDVHINAHCQSLLLVPCDASLPKFVVVKEDINRGPIVLRRIRWKIIIKGLTILVFNNNT